VLQLLVTANVVPSSPIRVTLMMEAIHSSEMSVLTRATWHHILEDGILHCTCHENLEPYIVYLKKLVTKEMVVILQELYFLWLKTTRAMSEITTMLS
jgi:hypothetical protein